MNVNILSGLQVILATKKSSYFCSTMQKWKWGSDMEKKKKTKKEDKGSKKKKNLRQLHKDSNTTTQREELNYNSDMLGASRLVNSWN